MHRALQILYIWSRSTVVTEVENLNSLDAKKDVIVANADTALHWIPAIKSANKV